MEREELLKRIENGDYDVCVKSGETHHSFVGSATRYSVGAIFGTSDSCDRWKVKEEFICFNTEDGLLDINGEPLDIRKYADLVSL